MTLDLNYKEIFQDLDSLCPLKCFSIQINCSRIQNYASFFSVNLHVIMSNKSY